MITPDRFGIMYRAAARGQEVRRRVGRDGQGELPGIQLGQRYAHGLRIRDADRIERDVHAVGDHVGYVVQMPVHGPLVEGVDLGNFGESVGRDNVLGNSFKRFAVAPREVQPGPLGRERPCDGTADRAPGPVDHGHLVLQQHLPLLSAGGHLSAGTSW
jgi:hypothetical protein